MKRIVFLIAAVMVLVALTSFANNPKEATNFYGKVTGVVKSAPEDGTSFIVTVSKAMLDETHDDGQTDPAGMVGKDLVIGTRLPRDKDGKPHPHADDVAYIKSLKPGMEVTVTLFAARADPNVLRLQHPGTPAPTTMPATAPAKP